MTAYGAAVRRLWPLEDDMLFLNHGSYGATPYRVLAAQDAWRDRLERQPCRFMRRELPPALRAAAGELAAFLGTTANRVGFVENTTCGINAILRSLRFNAGDEVIVTDHIYNAIRNALRHALRDTGARPVTVELGLPVADDDAVLAAIEAALTERTRLVMIDHVASASALVLPVERVIALCRARGVPVLVDGAHAPGMVALELDTLEADWYVGNCHKWLCAPKGAAFVWAHEGVQAELHPTVISHHYGEGFVAEFDYVGTRDASAWLAVPEAIRFHQELGGAELRARNATVARRAARALAAAFATETGGPDAMFGAMATVRVPWDGPATLAIAKELHARLWDRHRCETVIAPFAGSLWLRLSVQAYNEPDEYECLGALLRQVVADPASA